MQSISQKSNINPLGEASRLAMAESNSAGRGAPAYIDIVEFSIISNVQM